MKVRDLYNRLLMLSENFMTMEEFKDLEVSYELMNMPPFTKIRTCVDEVSLDGDKVVLKGDYRNDTE